MPVEHSPKKHQRTEDNPNLSGSAEERGEIPASVMETVESPQAQASSHETDIASVNRLENPLSTPGCEDKDQQSKNSIKDLIILNNTTNNNLPIIKAPPKNLVQTGIHKYCYILKDRPISNTINAPAIQSTTAQSKPHNQILTPKRNQNSKNTNLIPKTGINPNQNTKTQKRRLNHSPPNNEQINKFIKLSNRFTPLEIETVPDKIINKTNKNNTSVPISTSSEIHPSQGVKPVEKPPPIYLRIPIPSDLLKEINSITKKNFFLTCIRKGEITENKIQLPTVESYRTITNIMDHNDLPYYTYQIRSKRGQIVFIRGLDPEIDKTIIKEDLEDKGFKVKSILNITNKNKVPLPIFKIELDPTNEDRSAIYNVKYVARYKISVEAPHNKPRILQCSRCQEYNHTHNFCKLSPVCATCGGQHDTTTCRKTQEKLCCSNCGGEHLANDRNCEVYKFLKEKLQKNRPKNKQQKDFVLNPEEFLPLPNSNQNNHPLQQAQWPMKPPSLDEGLSRKIEILTDSINNLMVMMSSFLNVMSSFIENNNK